VTTHDEKSMREEKPPQIDSLEALMAYIKSKVEGDHDYGTCCYAMSLAATAAFDFVAGKLGVTGFQAGCASLDVLRRIKHLEGPFMIVDGSNALYPQYDLHAKLGEALEKWKPWLKEQAAKKLKESRNAAPGVIEHWKMLAAYQPSEEVKDLP